MIVHNKGKYIRHFGTVRLIPGTNRLNTEDTKAFKISLSNKLNKSLVDSREIYFEERKFTNLNAPDALELIRDTYDLSVLNQFLKDEEAKGTKKRSTIIETINAQIDAIKNPDNDKIVDPNE